MPFRKERATDPTEGQENVLALALLSLLVGVTAGFVGTVFRMALIQVDKLRGVVIDWSHNYSVGGFLLVIAICSSATALAAWLVRRFAPWMRASRHIRRCYPTFFEMGGGRVRR